MRYCKQVSENSYILVWYTKHIVDKKGHTVLRRHEKPTDKAGAKRFCKKWGITLQLLSEN